jgi:hypothetical protein
VDWPSPTWTFETGCAGAVTAPNVNNFDGAGCSALGGGGSDPGKTPAGEEKGLLVAAGGTCAPNAGTPDSAGCSELGGGGNNPENTPAGDENGFPVAAGGT